MSSPHKIEFKIGDTVTYHPYEHSYKRIVIGVRGHINDWGNPVDEVDYELATPGDLSKKCTRSTGLCIEESIYFNEYIQQYRNFYYHCGEKWTVTGNRVHKEPCPVCGVEVSPTETEKFHNEDIRGDDHERTA